MARSGRFGRLPRTAPNLASVMISLFREMQAQRDRNIVEAWQVGGEVEGKKITDTDLLEHFRERRDHVSEDDPLWDYYDNLVKNYEFRISDSKMTLSYAQGKTTDVGMAAFYEAEAAKHPVTSEVYRDLMRTAAGYRDRARQMASAGASRARGQAYQNNMDLIDARYHRPFQFATLVVEEVARQLGILQGTETMEDLRASGLREEDFGRIQGMFSEMWTSDDEQIIRLRGFLVAEGLGGLTYNQYNSMAGNATTGWFQKADLARANGEWEDAARFEENGFEQQELAWFINDATEGEQYADRRSRWESRITDPTLTPWERERINSQQIGFLTELEGRTTSGALGGAIRNDILSLQGQPSGSTPPEGGTSQMSDAEATALSVRDDRAMMNAVASGQMVWTQTTDGNNNRVWDVVPSGYRNPKEGITVMGRVNGQTVPIWVPFHNIVSAAWQPPDPRTGTSITPKDALPNQDPSIGKYYIGPSGEVVYLIPDENGNYVTFDHAPWNPDLSPSATIGDDGVMKVEWVEEGTNQTTDITRLLDPAQMAGDGDNGWTPASPYSQYASWYIHEKAGRLAIQTMSDGDIAASLAQQGVPAGEAATIVAALPLWREEGRAQANRDAYYEAKVIAREYGITVGGGVRAQALLTGGGDLEAFASRPEGRAALNRQVNRDEIANATSLLEAAGIEVPASYIERLGGLSPAQLADWTEEMERRAVVMNTPVRLRPLQTEGERQRNLALQREQTALRIQGQGQMVPVYRFNSRGAGQYQIGETRVGGGPYAPPPLPGYGGGAPGGGYGPGRPPPPTIKVPAPPPAYRPPPPPRIDPRDLGETAYRPPPPPTLPKTYPSTGKPIEPHWLE